MLKNFIKVLCFVSILNPILAGEFKDKVAIVTGASKGIGKSIALSLAEKGAKVVLVSRTKADLDAVAEEINKQGGEGVVFVADVGDEKAMNDMANFAEKKYGRIDIMVHNAGIYPVKRLEEMESDLWNKVIQTNLTSAFYVTKACTPIMKKHHYGRIIMITSTSGPVMGYPKLAHYTASKAGMVGFIKTAAIELAKYNITVNGVAPGTIFTEGLEVVPQERLDKMRNAIPMKRLGLPKEVAHAVTFLASEEASFITGENVIVDGGQTLPENQGDIF